MAQAEAKLLGKTTQHNFPSLLPKLSGYYDDAQTYLAGVPFVEDYDEADGSLYRDESTTLKDNRRVYAAEYTDDPELILSLAVSLERG